MSVFGKSRVDMPEGLGSALGPLSRDPGFKFKAESEGMREATVIFSTRGSHTRSFPLVLISQTARSGHSMGILVRSQS